MPDVRSAIDELRQSLRSVRDERELLLTIADRVDALRDLYRRDRSLFAEDDIRFLRGLTPVTRALGCFVEEQRRRSRASHRLANARQLALL